MKTLDIITKANQIAWDNETSNLGDIALQELRELRNKGNPEAQRAILLLTYYGCLANWSPNLEALYPQGDPFRDSMLEGKESALRAVEKLKELLGIEDAGYITD